MGKFLKTKTDFAPAHCLIAETYTAKKKYNLAQKSINKAIRLNKFSHHFYSVQGEIHFKKRVTLAGWYLIQEEGQDASGA